MDVGLAGSLELSYLVLSELDDISPLLGDSADVDIISSHYY
jgi:hypothetical protein